MIQTLIRLLAFMLGPATIPDFTPFFKPRGSIVIALVIVPWQVVVRLEDLRGTLSATSPNSVSFSVDVIGRDSGE